MRGLRRRVCRLEIAAAVLCLVNAAACGSMVHVATEPASSDAGAADEQITVNLRLRPDVLLVSINNLGDAPVDILWNKASFVDTDGNTSGVVHGGAGPDWTAPDLPGDVSRVPPHAILDDVIVPTRSVVYDRDYGWVVQPILPVECGPVRCVGYHELVGKTVRLSLTMQVDGAERVFDTTLRITKAVRSSRGTRPDEATLD